MYCNHAEPALVCALTVHTQYKCGSLVSSVKVYTVLALTSPLQKSIIECTKSALVSALTVYTVRVTTFLLFIILLVTSPVHLYFTLYF